MTDIFDRAQAIEEKQRELSLQNRFKAVHRISLQECQDCGEPIPEQRRKMVQGCTRCVDCQQVYEQRLKGFRR
ncbi:TraR/DksA family transcriptional regulator [Pasteurella bettyae]|uniref:Phage/conjugal plasmid C-4 type zinc finger protein, TraR family n=1 Tax=Pasteurella bettyae CCUG 2042 TaxID=1095749 RepID=I3DCP2_9PAST|nr:TraR/DksA C4-type zinc finger protein [Pasteurella bettyae]EIJ69485.1 phage/conjugal plasmid C-4 type zinc finger protein, TraR family [Pasteurella bettyae CCUG 2042]SUB20758.1 conjugal transfer protein TraR [Pasteurella bettyae]SUB21320.1 conjugal transfer protein TraR [Pasteurella bettyae]